MEDFPEELKAISEQEGRLLVELSDLFLRRRAILDPAGPRLSEFRNDAQRDLELLRIHWSGCISAATELQSRILRGATEEPGPFRFDPRWLLAPEPVVDSGREMSFPQEVTFLRRVLIEDGIDTQPGARRIRSRVLRPFWWPTTTTGRPRKSARPATIAGSSP